MHDGKPDCYAFQAVIVETSAAHAAHLRERFLTRGDPLTAKNYFPYVGRYQFIPFLKSKEWSTEKIFTLAKLHSLMINSLKPVFVHNLQDLRTLIGPSFTLHHGFYGIKEKASSRQPGPNPLIYYIHNTSIPTTKVALVTQENLEEAITQLSVVRSILLAKAPPRVPRQHLYISSSGY
jgi:hypothetical protein